MMIVSPNEMRRLEEESPFSSLALMTQVGHGLARYLKRHFAPCQVLIICGPGGNGGDGWALGERLRLEGFAVDIYELSEPRIEASIIMKEHYHGQIVTKVDKPYDLLIDAGYGYHFKGSFKEEERPLFRALNQLVCQKIAIDLPSGLNGLNGQADIDALSCHQTIVIGYLKYGHLLECGPDLCGYLSVLPLKVNKPSFRAQRVDLTTFYHLFSKRPHRVHKGSFGRLTLIAGSRHFAGASLLSAQAMSALRLGVGYSELATITSLYQEVAVRYPELIIQEMPEKEGHVHYDEKMLSALIQRSTVIAYGNGVGQSQDTALILTYLLAHDATFIIDGDGLTLLADQLDNLQKTTAQVVLTPHLKEFARLCHSTVHDVLNDPIQKAQDFALKYHCLLVLKSNTTIITDGHEIFLSDHGHPCLAKSGSGDLLLGLVGAFVTRYGAKVSALSLAAYLLGELAHEAITKLDEDSVIASDLLALLPSVYRKLKRRCLQKKRSLV